MKLNRDSALVRVAGLVGALGVGLGAFGAHALRPLLQQNGRIDTWETAVFYHLIHSVVLLVLALWPGPVRGPWICFLCGIAVFSGTLYALSITNILWLGAITPLGGAALIAGWLWLLVRPPSAQYASNAGN